MNAPTHTITEYATALGRALRAETLFNMHGLIRDGVAREDALPESERRHGFRRHSDFKEQADAFEAIMRERAIAFTPISW